ncbi:hypothetical protein B296_00032180 [Ensete ventricosum]|uniref:Uncharacterized protein n=1 Tax=Ensete ventricosum TaxID=4639 RepID=A0A427A1P8_ENSVE|nr:hypothetical protein B296_00032180 [Ensete ventricosum]
MVRRLPSMKLPGERDGRIWMWHRCLRCEKDKDGVPPAARRVIMSDAAWGLSFGKFLELSFSSQLMTDQPKGGSEADTSGPLVENPCYRRLRSPFRVYSFDSALRFQKGVHGRFLPASLHLPSAKSFDFSGGLASRPKDPITSMRRAYSQSSPSTVQRLDDLLNHIPLRISSSLEKIADGARLLLPQNALDDIVVAVYDDEPTSIISYALTSQDYNDYITSSLDETVSHKAKFSVTCYFAKQFHALRKICCPSELDYIRSLSRCKRWSAQGAPCVVMGDSCVTTLPLSTSVAGYSIRSSETQTYVPPTHPSMGA